MLSKLGGFVYFFTFWGSWWLSRNGTFLFVFVLSLPLRILAKENVASKATIFQAILTIQNLNKTTQFSLHQNIKGFTTFTLTIGVSERCPVLFIPSPSFLFYYWTLYFLVFESVFSALSLSLFLCIYKSVCFVRYSFVYFSLYVRYSLFPWVFLNLSKYVSRTFFVGY